MPDPAVAQGGLDREAIKIANLAWETLLRAHASMMRGFLADDIWDQISAREYDVLYTLSKARGPVRQSEVLRGVVLSQPALSRLIDRLVCRGLVTRADDPDDRRSVLLGLSDRGRELQRAVGTRHGKIVAERMWQHLDREEMATLTALAAKLT
ncbi:MarR family winged helix-turn-helix transcriptional regulator [Rarobacter incanus]|nr:MarR family transcriptional regulator [Rarobacter incanus]